MLALHLLDGAVSSEGNHDEESISAVRAAVKTFCYLMPLGAVLPPYHRGHAMRAAWPAAVTNPGSRRLARLDRCPA